MQELYDFYKQSAESYMILLKGSKTVIRHCWNRGKKCCERVSARQILLLEDAKT